MGLNKNKIKLLREFVDFKCLECGKHEDKVGTLQPHKINPELGYILLNIKPVCKKCHDYYSSADRIARSIQG